MNKVQRDHIIKHETDQAISDYMEEDKKLYRQRHKIENLFARLKDWRRIHTRYDRRADTFMAAITIAAICTFWIN